METISVATDKCEGSYRGRISPGIQWTWSQTRDTCPSRVDTCPLLTLLPDELQRSVRGQIGVEFHQESSGHSLRHMICEPFDIIKRVYVHGLHAF